MTDEVFPAQAEHDQLMEVLADNAELKEGLERVRAQYLAMTADTAGWKRIFGGGSMRDDNSGLELDDLKTISEKLKEEVAGSALPKRANEARYAYTFGKPFLITGLDELNPQKPPRRGPKSKLYNFFNSETAQNAVFSEEAQAVMHASSSTNGAYLLLGEDNTKKVYTLPLSQISNTLTHPDFTDIVWAYERTWERQVTNSEGVNETQTLSQWIYTDRYDGPRPPRIGKVPVAQDHTIIDAVFNRQEGWTWGVPDLMAAQIWNQKYLTMIAYGEQVTETLAYFAAKVKVQSQAGANNVGLKMGNAGGPKGQTVAYGAGNEVDVFSSAGKTYDFPGLRIFASFYAAAVGIPLPDLTADPGAAGSSYGSAAALVPGARRLIEARRSQWARWIQRVLKWAINEDVVVTPASIMEEDEYRTTQKYVMAWDTGLFEPDELRAPLARAVGIPLTHATAPKGVITPNNLDSIEAQVSAMPKQAAAPGQGKSNSTGGQSDGSKKDIRRDTISNNTENSQLMAMMALEDRMDALMAVVMEMANRS